MEASPGHDAGLCGPDLGAGRTVSNELRSLAPSDPAIARSSSSTDCRSATSPLRPCLTGFAFLQLRLHLPTSAVALGASLVRSQIPESAGRDDIRTVYDLPIRQVAVDHGYQIVWKLEGADYSSPRGVASGGEGGVRPVTARAAKTLSTRTGQGVARFNSRPYLGRFSTRIKLESCRQNGAEN